MKKLIGLAGCIGSGKDTVAEYLCQYYDFRRIAMAEKLKKVTSELFGWDLDVVNGYTPEAREAREIPDPYWSNALGRKWSPRIALQYLGTEVFRENLHDDFWVQVTTKSILDHPGSVVISDVRFSNEAKMIHDLGGKVWRIRRNTDPEWSRINFNTTQQLVGYFSNRSDVHASEWSSLSPEMKYDRVIDNDSSLEVLYNNVESFLQN